MEDRERNNEVSKLKEMFYWEWGSFEHVYRP